MLLEPGFKVLVLRWADGVEMDWYYFNEKQTLTDILYFQTRWSGSKMEHTSINRRTFIKNISLGIAGLAFPLKAFSGIQPAQQSKKPNVLLIYSDDQGAIDLNIYGAKDLDTPNLDALARRGTRFTQFDSAAPVCSPSRAALLTGRYPQRAGLPGNAPSMQGHAGMPTEQVTIAEMMKKAGYVTGHVGKWHLGYTPDTMPNGQGFDYSFGFMGGCIDNYSHFFYWNGPNRHDLWRNDKEVWYEGDFFGDLMVKECNQFLEEHQKEPFFLYWAINIPHYPLQGKGKWRERYADLDAPRRMYAAWVSTMDDLVGQVMAKLDELGLREDTIVIFQADQGFSTEVRAFGGGGNAGALRGAKFSLFEGGIRVPAFVSWPGHIPENEVRDQLVTNCDWMPTIAELCDVDLPDYKIDGESMVQVIKSPKAPTTHHTFYWQSGRGKWGPQWSVREGDWKLIGNPNDTSHKAEITEKDRLFLVNLSEDVTEMTNLAPQHPDIVGRLEALHEKWLRDVE